MNSTRIGAFLLYASLLLANAARGADEIRILSPTANTEFALDRITLSVAIAPSIARVKVTVKNKEDKDVYESEVVELQRGPATWSPEVPLVAGVNKITVSEVGGSGAFVTVQITRTTAATAHDARETFSASFFNGLSIDNFASGELKRYAGQSNSADPVTRFVGGFSFEYRLYGNPANARGKQLWVYGETVHGVRSTDVDCGADPKPPVCDVFNVATAGDRTLFILRSASSLEAFMGMRWEFLPVQLGSESPARLYLKGQLGFLAVSEKGSDVVDIHHLGLGAIATGGRYRGSYLEVGWGKNDLFAKPSPGRNFRGRFLVDGFLNWHPDWMSTNHLDISPFVQFILDSDLGPGSDSIQTYIGFQFDLKRLFGR